MSVFDDPKEMQSKQRSVFDDPEKEQSKQRSVFDDPKAIEKKPSNEDYFYEEETGTYWPKNVTPQEILTQLSTQDTLPAKQLARGSIAGKYLTDIPNEERSRVMEMIGSGPELMLSRGGGTIPGAMAGATAGSVFGPAGTVVGGAIGGFIGGVSGMTAYETAKRYVEGEEISAKQITEDAATFAAWEGALKLLGKAISSLKTTSSAKQLVSEVTGLSDKEAKQLIKTRAGEKKLNFVDAAKTF